MKRNFGLKLLVLVITIFILFTVQAVAEQNKDVIEENTCALIKLDILRGYQEGVLKLDEPITRAEFITMVIRLMSYDTSTYKNHNGLSFIDMDDSKWYYNNMNIALKHGLIIGYDDNTIRPDNQVTYPEACIVLIRALGYTESLEGKWPDNAVNMAAELNIDRNVAANTDRKLTRGESSVLIYNSLTVDFKDPERYGSFDGT